MDADTVSILAHVAVIVVIVLKLFLDMPLIVRNDPPDVKTLRERGWHNYAQSVPFGFMGLGMIAVAVWAMTWRPGGALDGAIYWMVQACFAVLGFCGTYFVRLCVRRWAVGRTFLAQVAAREKDPS